jgi:NAD(P)-dependent dehydrogenase (short-subunit alcohol dehydrogenase family)
VKNDHYAEKTVVITGGASGIGAALGRELARRGAQIVLADRQLDLAETVVSEIVRSGGRAVAMELDVRKLTSMQRVVDETLAKWKRVDYFFNNAGIGVAGEMDGFAPEDWDDVIDVNLRGVAHGVQAVYPVMIRQGSGHIVNTASMAGLVGAAGEGSYTATKHAVVGLTKSLRVEAKRHGVRVSVLCPGAVRTPILTGGKFGRLNFVGLSDRTILDMWATLRPMDVDAFALATARAVARNEFIIVFPRWWKAFWWAERLSPNLSVAIWSVLSAKMRKDIEASGARPRQRGEPSGRDHAPTDARR